MKPIITPSILSFDPGKFSESTAQVMQAGADWIHLDVMDGQFVPPITFGADLAASLRQLGDTPLEAHLMTLTPERHFDAFISAGCTRITFHTEATVHCHRHCMALHERGIQAGIAINPSTPAEAVRPLLDAADLILVMTVNPGWGGQAFIESCLDKVQQIREWAPEIEVQVDGGIDPLTLPRAWDAGANVFVSGSYLAKSPTIAQGMEELRCACRS